MFFYPILNFQIYDVSTKFWKIPNPSAVYKWFLFYWPLFFKFDILCPPDVWKTSCCIEVVTLCLAVGAAAQVDHTRHTWSEVWNSVFFSCHFVSCQKPKFGGRQPRRTGIKRIGKEKREKKGRNKDEEKERNISRLLISGDGTGRRSEGDQRD